jgi:hypothetical protein
VHKPKLSEAPVWKDSCEIAGNFLILELAESGTSGSLRSIPGLSPRNCFDLSAELKRMISGGAYPAVATAGALSGESKRPRSLAGLLSKNYFDLLLDLKRTIFGDTYPDRAAGPIVLLDRFDYNLNSREYNLVRLNLLERLTYESACRILLVSSVDPLYFLTDGAPQTLSDTKEPEVARNLLDRWALVLSKFERVRARASESREFTKKVKEFIRSHPDRREFAIRVREECNSTSILRRIGTSILDDFDESDPVTRNWIARKVLDRAESYYRVLWSSLTSSERLVLYQLAQDGWANPKNTAAFQQLESKYLIRKLPMYRIMNESFRSFIASTEHADEIGEWEKQQKQSTWRVFRLVTIALGLALGIWFFHSQAALSKELAGYVAAVATLLTTVSALFGHSGKQTSAKPESS